MMKIIVMSVEQSWRSITFCQSPENVEILLNLRPSTSLTASNTTYTSYLHLKCSILLVQLKLGFLYFLKLLKMICFPFHSLRPLS